MDLTSLALILRGWSPCHLCGTCHLLYFADLWIHLYGCVYAQGYHWVCQWIYWDCLEVGPVISVPLLVSLSLSMSSVVSGEWNWNHELFAVTGDLDLRQSDVVMT